VVVVGPQLAVTVLAAPVGATDKPFTVIVKVFGVPVQPAPLLGVTVIVAVTAFGVLFTATKLGILPVPVAARPMLGVLFVQLYVIGLPVVGLLNVMAAVDWPAHSVWLATVFTTAVGLTVMVNVTDVPGQPAATGVTVIVAVTGALVVLVAVKLGMLPVPDAARPILGVLFVQLNTVPATGLVKVTAVVLVPLHTVWLAGVFTLGVGLTVSVAIIAGPSQPFILGIMVKVTITGVVPVVVKVPVILPVPLAAMPVAVATLSLVHLYTVPATGLVKLIGTIGVPEQLTWNAGVATAVVVGWMVTVAVTGVPTHPAAVGVMVNVTVIGALVVLIINPVMLLPLPLACIPPGAVVLVVLFLVHV
jgi:hypothetical protein